MSPILRAILAILVSVMCFSVLNAMSKTLSQGYPVIEVIWARYFFAFLLMLAMFLPRSGLNLFRFRNLGSQVVRGLLLFFSSFLYFHGIVYMPLATAAAISLTSPLIVTALSRALPAGAGGTAPLGRRGCVGFIGALIVVRPGQAAVRLACAADRRQHACAARSTSSISRRYGQTERPDASATMATIVGTVAASPFLPFEWVTPTGGWHWALFAGMGVMAGIGHYFLTIAYSQAPAAVVAPFNYTQLIGAALLGYLVFGDIPDFWSWVGAGVIVCLGPLHRPPRAHPASRCRSSRRTRIDHLIKF